MTKLILTADWHLTDATADEYRWKAFDTLLALAKKHREPNGVELFILGDLTDRKDRHSATLVNCLVDEFYKLKGFPLSIIMGNHDQPLKGAPFWQFLNKMGILFADKPHALDDLLLLPYSHNPIEEWRGIPYKNYKALFMHQTVTGVIGENGKELTNDKMPLFPRHLRIYSGDIHTPQKVGLVEYVGAPHPVKFGDDYPCRMLVLDDRNFSIIEAVPLLPIKKLILTIRDTEDLDRAKTSPNDQVRIRFEIAISHIQNWPVIQAEIKDWARRREIMLASIEALVQLQSKQRQNNDSHFQVETPADILQAYCEEEGIEGPVAETGRNILAGA
jgi:DNA repair exonuclease SbcCD nuclease subunit